MTAPQRFEATLNTLPWPGSNMTEAAIVILAGQDSHADRGRVTNALVAAKEFRDAGDDVKVIFDGAGTEWLPELTEGDDDLSPLFDEIEDVVDGACAFCSDAFGVRDEIEGAVPLLKDHEGHPSIRSLVEDGYEVVTF